MEYNCNLCSKNINFTQIDDSLDKVIMINYFNYYNSCNGIIVLCSRKCRNNYKFDDVIACVQCHKKCQTSKWFVNTKFINLGGWSSSKAICSEYCYDFFTTLIKKDQELDIKQQCAYCSKLDDSNMKRCSKCRITYYCGENCQKMDWAKHKLYCK
jgi:hypothetical protein